MSKDLRDRRRANLKRLLQPQHIAFVGGRAIEPCIVATRKAGFKGRIDAVHPKYKSMVGVPCVPTLADLPEAPDATLIAVSRERTVGVVAELSAMGAGGAVSIVGEFAEAGEGGAAVQARLVEAAGDLALVGPNCLGVMNLFDGSAVWGGDNVFEAADSSGVALISQSGYVAYSITNVEQAFPLGYAISMGNQAVLDVADFIDAMLDDNRVRAIGLYLEGIVDVAALSEAALRALEKGVPLVALKAGGTEESAELTRSHSGTLAVANELWSALFRRLGMIQVGSPKALIETLKLLGGKKSVAGNRIFAAANSGGYAAMIGEKGRYLGLEFPAPGEEQRAALREAVPDLVSLLNPLDWNLPWSSMESSDTSEIGMGLMMNEHCDLLVYFVDWPRQKDVAEVWWPTLEGLIRLNNRVKQPVVVASVLPDGLPADLRQKLAKAGITTLQGLDDGLAAIGAASGYPTLRASVLADRDARLLPLPTMTPADARLMDEAETKALLEAYGVVTPARVAGISKEVVRRCDSLGYPVAVKLLNADLAHKNHAGAVHLNVQDAGAVTDAIAIIQKSVASYDPSLSTDRFLLERMVESSRAEFIAGISQKPGLGHALIIGRGGTAVEELRDFVTLLLPASKTQIEEALESLTITQVLRLSASERTALVEAIAIISQFAYDHRDRLMELDVNPLILDASGGVTAVDALIRMAD